MIPRLNRLPTIRLVNSQVINTPLFMLRFSRNNLSYPRFALVVSKRIDKRAVVRNRLKRVLREIAYVNMLHKTEGVDLLFVIKKNFMDFPKEEVEAVVKEALQRLPL